MTELPAIPPIESPGALRQSLRETAYPRPTFGVAPGYLQCNLLIVPHGLAHDFSTFCAANPAACPLIYQTSPGQWDMPELGTDIDLRRDVGSYRLFRDGQAVADLLHLDGYWQGDFVTFVLGSSFGLEAVLAGHGIDLPYLARGEAPAHYITGLDSESSGTFRGPSAVTMRSLRAADADKLEALCAAYPHLHGAPLAVGDPDALGIETLEAPVADVGRPATVRNGEVPVFWASALTAQLALSAARLPFCIANTPGHLLVTDIEVEALRQAAGEATGDADARRAAPVEIRTGAAAADGSGDGAPGFASAIRPARAVRPAETQGHVDDGPREWVDATADPFPFGDDDGADPAALRRIDEEETAAIAADAAEDRPEEDERAAEDDIPPFADEPVDDADRDDGGDPLLLDNGAVAAAPEYTTAHLPPPMEWHRPPPSAGKLIRQRLAAASTPSQAKRESIFW